MSFGESLPIVSMLGVRCWLRGQRPLCWRQHRSLCVSVRRRCLLRMLASMRDAVQTVRVCVRFVALRPAALMSLWI